MGIVNEMGYLDAGVLSRNTKACPEMKGRPPCDTISQNENVNPYDSCLFVAKSLETAFLVQRTSYLACDDQTH